MTDQPPTQMSPIFAARIREMLNGGLTTEPPAEVRLADVAPYPENEDTWTFEALIRWHTARAATRHAATHKAAAKLVGLNPDSPEFAATARDLYRNGEAGTTNLAVALLLHIIATKAPELTAEATDALWEVAPERGALNGEWEDITRALLRRYGVTTGHQVLAAEPSDLTPTT